MARRFISSSSQYLERSAAVATAAPLTMACWLSRTSGVDMALMALNRNSGTIQEFSLLAFSTGELAAQTVNSTVAQAATASQMTIGNWHHCTAVFASATSRSVFINGSSKVTNTTSKTPTGINTTAIGRVSRATPAFYNDGQIHWPAIWSVALTDAEVLRLAQGVDPRMIRPQNLVAFWPLTTPGTSQEFDANLFSPRRYDLTVTGATPANDPFTLPTRSAFQRQIYSFAPPAAVGGLVPRLIQPRFLRPQTIRI